MNHLAQPAPKVEAVFVGKAPLVEEAKTDDARVVSAATVEKAIAVGPAVLFDPKRDAPQMKVTSQETGISVQALRGTSGADFESTVALLRGAPKKNFLKKHLPLFFDERDFVSFGEVRRFVVIKGDCCFVFFDDKDVQPLYAIPLDEVIGFVEDPKKPDKLSVTISPNSTNGSKDEMITVLLKYRINGLQAYQFTFDASADRSVAKRFLDVVQNSTTKPKTVSASIYTANTVGKEAAKSQPDNEHKK